jgi:excisionase family DNA binding protein
MVDSFGRLSMLANLDQSQLRDLVLTILRLQEPQPERLAFNLAEASELTGVPERQLRLAIARRQLKGRRIGKAYCISRRSLLDWLDSQ